MSDEIDPGLQKLLGIDKVNQEYIESWDPRTIKIVEKHGLTEEHYHKLMEMSDNDAKRAEREYLKALWLSLSRLSYEYQYDGDSVYADNIDLGSELSDCIEIIEVLGTYLELLPESEAKDAIVRPEYESRIRRRSILQALIKEQE